VAPPTLFDVSLDELRQRRSEKWRRYPADVLPAWVAELDFALAPPVQSALAAALELDPARVHVTLVQKARGGITITAQL